MLLLCVLLASACATTHTRPAANIPAIRHQINDAIAADGAGARRTGDFHYEAVGGAPAGDAAGLLPASRTITAMGRVLPDRAVVYTRRDGKKLEETWVREADGWKLAHVKELGGAAAQR